jgi:hypothetical protein
MNTFLISEEALEEIQRILHMNKYSDPVAVLTDMANPEKYMDDVKKALLEGDNRRDLIPLARSRLEEIKDQLTYYLMIAVYEKRIFKSEYLTNINGITFAMSVNMREALRGYCLTFEGGLFMLRSADYIASNLRSVIKLDKPA